MYYKYVGRFIHTNTSAHAYWTERERKKIYFAKLQKEQKMGKRKTIQKYYAHTKKKKNYHENAHTDRQNVRMNETQSNKKLHFNSG